MNPSLKEITKSNVDKALSRHRHDQTLASQVRTQNTILTATTALIKYLDGHTTKTEVVNQLKTIGTPDVANVVKAVNALHSTLKDHKDTDLSEVTKLMQGILNEAKLIPKSLPEAKEQRFIDYTGQLSSLTQAIKAVQQVVKEQKLIAEAPIVNVASPTIQVDAPDLAPLQAGFIDVVHAIEGVIIPDYQTDNKEVEKLLKISNKLLKELLEKPVSSGGGGGGGRVSPYEDASGMPAFVTLDSGAIPTVTGLVPKQFDAIYITSKNANGDPLVVNYKRAAATVATLTIVYDTDGDIISVVRS